MTGEAAAFDLYDPELRRETPLQRRLVAMIVRNGPMPVSEYMRHCLLDPEHGYYRTRQVLGEAGDFTTAPEISQIFGELIGLWAALVWQQLGAPSRVTVVELGPGRGTLMRDMLRVARIVPGFIAAADVHLVEASEALKAVQRATLDGCGVPLAWHSSHATVPDGPAILVGNEYLDAFPIDQWRRLATGWQRRHVVVADGRLEFDWRGEPSGPLAIGDVEARSPTSQAGAIIESRSGVPGGYGDELFRLERAPGVALLLDYGHAAPAAGDTLQAVRRHRFEHPLTSPGEADLTAQVDFAELMRLPARPAGRLQTAGRLAWNGPVTQAEFLGRLGIAERASRLMSANPVKAAAIETAVARLMAPGGMGGRFQVVAARSVGLPPPPGFDAPGRHGI